MTKYDTANSGTTASVLLAKDATELLWKRIKQRGDMPGFENVTSAILSAVRGEGDCEFNMTGTVLADPALTQKVLRLANSAMYSVFGQGINTVAKAVLVLGTESIGHLALCSKLVDGLSQAANGSSTTFDEMKRAVLAGHIARQVTTEANSRDVEEAVVCSMLHGLGRILVSFYLQEYWTLIQDQVIKQNADESEATHAVLGMGLDEVGRVIAQKWGIPESITNSMTDEPPLSVDEPLAHGAWLRAISTMTSSCAKVLCEDTPMRDEAMLKIADAYADMLGVAAAQLVEAAKVGQSCAEQENQSLTLDDSGKSQNGTPPAKLAKAAACKPLVLKHGVTDMRGVLNSATTHQLITMAVETAYQGLGLTRAIVFLRNNKEGTYFARLGFGQGLPEILPQLCFSDAYQPDVFHAGLANDRIVLVKDARDPAFANRLPRWWVDALPKVRSFIVLPLTINRHPIGFIYGDWDTTPPENGPSAEDFLPLNDLRALTAQALIQRSQLESSLSS